MVSESPNKNCAICCSEVSTKENETRPLGILGSQLNVIFILRNIFEVKCSLLESLLQKWEDPDKWLKLCEKCDKNVTDIRKIFQRLHEITRELQKAKCVLQERIRMSEEKQEVNVDIHEVVKECRRSYCRRKVTPFPPASSPFENGDLMASEMALSKKNMPILKEEVTADSQNLIADFTEDIFPQWKLEVLVNDHHVLDSSGDKDQDNIVNDDQTVGMATTSDSDTGKSNDDDNGDFKEQSHRVRKRKISKSYTEAEVDSKDVPSDPDNSESDGENDQDQDYDDDYNSDGLSFKSGESSSSDEDSSEHSEDDDDDDDDTPQDNSKVRGIQKKTSKSRMEAKTSSNDASDDDDDLPISRRTKTNPRRRIQKRKSVKVLKTNRNCKTEFKCDLCQKQFLHETSLSYHISKYHERKQEKKCTECDEVLIDLIAWGMHMRTAHNQDVRHPCPIESCPFMLWSKDRVRAHLKRRHQDNYKPMRQPKHVCPNCEKKYWNADRLQKHMENCQIKEYRCQWCPQEEFSNREEYLKHRNTHSNRNNNPVKRMRNVEKIKSKTNIKPGDEKTEFTCDTCQKTFAHVNALYLHIQKYHERKEERKCSECGEVLIDLTSWGMHMRTAHNIDVKHPCPVEGCHIMLWSKERIPFHLRRYHSTNNSGPFNYHPCPKCGKKYHNADLLEKHKKKSPRCQKLWCHWCHIEFSTSSEYLEHKKKHRSGNTSAETGIMPKPQNTNGPKEKRPLPLTLSVLPKYELDMAKVTLTPDAPAGTCNLCGKHFKLFKNLKEHVRTVHDKSEKCHICGKVSKSVSGLMGHLEIVHRIGEFHCDECSRLFLTEIRLFRHKRVEHSPQKEERQSTCEICGKIFKSFPLLKWHVTTVHDRKNERICPICSKRIITTNGYRVHMMEIHELQDFEMPPPLSQLPEEERQKLELNLEVKRKVFQQKSQCDLCGKEFQTRRGLKQHMHNSHQRTELKCGVNGCSKTYTSQVLLESHRKSKHENRSYCCMYCGKEFATRMGRRKHELSFHKKDSKPFTCVVYGCDKAFSKQGFLDKHLKKDHNINESVNEESGVSKTETA